MVRYKSLEEFLEALGFRESSGNYAAVNQIGYLGKYQMGDLALTDAGYYKPNSKGKSNDWSGQFTGKDNVYSKEDFLNNPQAQENAIRAYMRKQWKYLKDNGATNAVGSQINGIDITQSGLLGGAHLVGSGSMGDYVNSNGTNIPKDGNKISVEEYLKKFSGYDVSTIIDPNYDSPKFTGDKTDFANKVINQGSNLITNVANKVSPFTQIPESITKNYPIQPPLTEEEWLKRLRRQRMGL